jgi:hypothetical protein
VDMGRVSDVSHVHAASVFGIEMCRVHAFVFGCNRLRREEYEGSQILQILKYGNESRETRN